MIVTERLLLLPATVESSRAALEGDAALGASLAAVIPTSWPPALLDPSAIAYMRDRLLEGPEQAGWWLHFVVLAPHSRRRTLIGSVGYKGPPSEDGTVEVGYGILPDYQRCGYAHESVRGLIAHAFRVPAVRRIIAETYPALTASIALLRKCGFALAGEGSEPGVIRFELPRPARAAVA